jgi:signal transduction histidine kinase
MLHSFLLEYQNEILEIAARESRLLAGVRPNSDQLKRGLPVFYLQLVNDLKLDEAGTQDPLVDRVAAEEDRNPERLGFVLFSLGYTLSHVVHVYGALCQAITSLAITKTVNITSVEFRSLYRFLDVAIADAVTDYQSVRDVKAHDYEVQRCGSCAHELRNALGGATLALQMIKAGSVGFSGSTGKVLDRSLKRLDELIGRSLTQVKLRSGAVLQLKETNLLLLVDEILVTANIEAKFKSLAIETDIDPDLYVNVDSQLFHSAISNLIQNALKYSRAGGRIQIRGHQVDEKVVIEVEDECGGLKTDTAENLFEPFEQQNDDRKGLGLGLTIARKAIELHQGTIKASNLPGRGCVFTVTLPKNQMELTVS